MSDNAYINALRLGSSRYQAELLIRTILEERPLSNLEYRRTHASGGHRGPVLASPNIGPGAGGPGPQDAYQAFEILVQRGELSADGLSGWRKIIGLRNALVHDYLNIDPEIIRSVIAQGYSEQLPAKGSTGWRLPKHRDEKRCAGRLYSSRKEQSSRCTPFINSGRWR